MIYAIMYRYNDMLHVSNMNIDKQKDVQHSRDSNFLKFF